jgi:glycosyltransferase involved in cell wall biosynthesis
MKISIVTLTYGHENYIRQAIESILLQRGDFELELIIADDNSPDNTPQIVNDIIQSYPKAETIIKYTRHVNNRGVINNFIWALNQCTGEYIALCDGDDYWTDPLKLQKQLDFLEANSTYTGCFHNTETINEMESNPILKPWRTYTKYDFTLKDTLSATSLFHTSSFMFRTAKLKIPSWFKEVHSGDMSLFTIIASQGPLYRIDDNMSVYRKNQNGITNSINRIEYHSNRIKLFEYFNSYLNGRESEQSKMISDFHKEQLKKLNRTSLKKKLKQIFKM